MAAARVARPHGRACAAPRVVIGTGLQHALKDRPLSYRIETIVTALRSLGGRARPAQIAAEIRRLFPGPHPRTLLNSVRGRLQECSSDSTLFLGKRDLFYSVHGIGGGIWGLREMGSSYAPEVDRSVDETATRTNEPDFDRVIDRLEGGVRPAYGSPRERQGRRKLRVDIARLQKELTHLHPPHGGIGHNRPPADQREETIGSEIIVASFRETATIEAEIGKDSPDTLKIARSARWLQRFAHWVAGKADTFADEFVRSFGKSLGISAGAAVAAGGLVIALSHVIQSAASWLQLVIPGL